MRKYYAIRNKLTGAYMPHYQSRSMPAIYLSLKTAESVLKKLRGYRWSVGDFKEEDWEATEVEILPVRSRVISNDVTAGHEDY